MLSTVTGGAIVGYVTLVVLLLCCVAWAVLGVLVSREGFTKFLNVVGAIVCALITIGLWWWGMAFTTSSDYHAWNVKSGKVEKVAKRLIATDSGMAERYVVTINGQPYGIDDTRATLLESGDEVSLRCKKDYQWGVPRSAHGWACRWNGSTS